MMKDDFEAGELDAYVDGELELSHRLRIERAIANDAGLRARAENLAALRGALREHATYHAAPDALRQRIATLATPSRTRDVPVRHRWSWRPMAVAFAAALVLALGVQLALSNGRHDARLTDEVVASHVRSMLGERTVDVASSDHHTVKPWLSGRLDYSPPVRDTQLNGAAFVGGRIDYLDGRPVAALVYRQGPHLVNWFVWPTADPDRAETLTSARGFEVAHWTRAGMTHWVVSDLNRAEFSALVDALATNGPTR